jgi:hypothetical protein
MTSTRMTPVLAKAKLEHMKPSDFEFSCESFWSTRINECMRMCPWIRMHSYRMRIRNMRNIKKKNKYSIVNFLLCDRKTLSKGLCDFSDRLLSHNAPAGERQLYMVLFRVRTHKLPSDLAQTFLYPARFVLWN